MPATSVSNGGQFHDCNRYQTANMHLRSTLWQGLSDGSKKEMYLHPLRMNWDFFSRVLRGIRQTLTRRSCRPPRPAHRILALIRARSFARSLRSLGSCLPAKLLPRSLTPRLAARRPPSEVCEACRKGGAAFLLSERITFRPCRRCSQFESNAIPTCTSEVL